MEPRDAATASHDTRRNDGRHDVDVLIIGARIAGASLGLLLAQRGLRVLMVDRDQFPSDSLSTHYMLPRHVGLLAQLGVLEDIEAAGFRRITRTRTWVEDCMFEGPVAPAGVYALTPRRDVLDSVIAGHAVRHGAQFWERTRAEGLRAESGRVVGATVTSHDGVAREVRARIVVGADGRHSKVAEWVDAPRYHETPGLRPAYYGYFRGLEPLDEPALEMFFIDDRIGFVFPMQPGIDCLAIELQPEDFHVFRSNPREHFEERFRQLPTMARRAANIQLDGKMQGMHSIANFLRKPYGAGWALTGDAAFLKDPITGTGLGDALIHSMLMAPAIAAVLAGDAEWETAMAAVQQQRDAELAGALDFTVSVASERDPSAEQLDWLRAVLAVPHLTRTMAGGLPAALPEIMPAVQQPLVNMLAQWFGAAHRQAVATAADG